MQGHHQQGPGHAPEIFKNLVSDESRETETNVKVRYCENKS